MILGRRDLLHERQGLIEIPERELTDERLIDAAPTRRDGLAPLRRGDGHAQAAFTSIRRGRARSDFGTRTVSTPSFSLASMCSSSAGAGSVTRYSNWPVRRERLRSTP